MSKFVHIKFVGMIKFYVFSVYTILVIYKIWNATTRTPFYIENLSQLIQLSLRQGFNFLLLPYIIHNIFFRLPSYTKKAVNT